MGRRPVTRFPICLAEQIRVQQKNEVGGNIRGTRLGLCVEGPLPYGGTQMRYRRDEALDQLPGRRIVSMLKIQQGAQKSLVDLNWRWVLGFLDGAQLLAIVPVELAGEAARPEPERPQQNPPTGADSADAHKRDASFGQR